MKKLIFSLFATVLVSFFSFGKSIIKQIDPSNPNNKYDYIGVIHNEGLSNFVSNYKKINNLESNGYLNLEALLSSNTLYLGEDKTLLEFNSSFTKNSSINEYFKVLTSKNPDYIEALNILDFKASDNFKTNYQNILCISVIAHIFVYLFDK